MFKRLLNRILKLFERKHCGNCKYGNLEYVNKPIYNQYVYTYNRSKKKKIKRELIGFRMYTCINCKCPETQDKWAPYLRDMDYLAFSKPFKCCYYNRKETK